MLDHRTNAQALNIKVLEDLRPSDPTYTSGLQNRVYTMTHFPEFFIQLFWETHFRELEHLPKICWWQFYWKQTK